MDKICSAVQTEYRALDYTEQEYEATFLFHKLGGYALGDLAHRMFHLPSIETARRHIGPNTSLFAHSGDPSTFVEEHKSNLNHILPDIATIQTSLPPHTAPGQTPILGVQAMKDEVKINPRLRWDQRRNLIIGVARENAPSFSLVFKTIAQALAIREGIKSGKAALATNVRFILFLIIVTHN